MNQNNLQSDKILNINTKLIENLQMPIVLIFAWVSLHIVQNQSIMVCLIIVSILKIITNSNITWGKWLTLLIGTNVATATILGFDLQPAYDFIFEPLLILVSIYIMAIAIHILFDRLELLKAKKKKQQTNTNQENN